MLSGLSRPKVTNQGTLRASARRWVGEEALQVAGDAHQRLPHQPLAGAVGGVALEGRRLADSSRRARFSARSRSRAVAVERLGDAGEHQRRPHEERTQVSLRPAALRGVDHQRAVAQRDPREAAGHHDRPLAVDHERAQVNVAGLEAVAHQHGRARQPHGLLGDVAARVRRAPAGRRPARSPGVAWGPISMPVAAGAVDRLHHEAARGCRGRSRGPPRARAGRSGPAPGSAPPRRRYRMRSGT